MTVWVPAFAQGASYSAQIARFATRAQDWDEGVASRVDLKVSQRAAGANLSVDIAAGDCIVQGDDQANQGNYDVRSDAVVNLTGFSAPGSNSRYDLVVMQVNDPNAGGAAGDNAVIVRVAGTAAASPAIPAVPNSALLLAIVGPILTSTTSITNAMIHDAYTGTGPTGVAGARLCRGLRDTPGTSKETYGTVAPSGWLMEFGQAVSRATFARLFAEIGTTHGIGDGSTTFNLPDSRGRVAVGVGAGSFTVLGDKIGEETHALTTAELAAHSHTQNAHSHGGSTGSQSVDHSHSGTSSTESTAHFHSGTTGNESNTHAHNYNTSGSTTGAGGGTIQLPSEGMVATSPNAPGHTHAFVSGGQSVNHTHTMTTGGVSANHTHAVTADTAVNQNTGSNAAHNNIQPSIAILRCIRT